MLTIDRDPNLEIDDRAVGRALRKVLQEFPAVKVQGPSELDNRHRLLMIRLAASDALGDAATVDAQAHVLHQLLSGWSATLFSGGGVETALSARYSRWRLGK
jgi:hypothetical protein